MRLKQSKLKISENGRVRLSKNACVDCGIELANYGFRDGGDYPLCCVCIDERGINNFKYFLALDRFKYLK